MSKENVDIESRLRMQPGEMSFSRQPAVEPGQPPRFVLRSVNPLVSAILRSPFHRLLSKQFILLTLTGRRTGRTYRVPVGRHELDGTLTVAAGGAWWHNLRDQAPFRLTVEGREHRAYADLQEHPDAVAETYRRLLGDGGPRQARMLGLKSNVDRPPTVEEIKPAVTERAIASVHLLPDR